MSPEQARGLKVDTRTDIWSFGVMLYELLTRQLPFAGETTIDLMHSIIHKVHDPLEIINPDLPNKLFFIVKNTLQKNIKERYQTIENVLSDLQQVKQRLDYEKIELAILPDEPKTRYQPKKKKSAIIESESTHYQKYLPPNNLSSELSILIGREAEFAEIMKLLRQTDVRLLTLTGVGGTGKTRLAQAIAHESLTEFADGVYFINLAAIENPELVMPNIGQTLGIRQEGGKPLKECLNDYLHRKNILMVLDNFEQIAEASPILTDLLLDTLNLKILVTSRVRLNLRVEHEFTLQPLGVPLEKQLTTNEFGKYPAVALFVERAKAAKFDFALTKKTLTRLRKFADGLTDCR